MFVLFVEQYRNSLALGQNEKPIVFEIRASSQPQICNIWNFDFRNLMEHCCYWQLHILIYICQRYSFSFATVQINRFLSKRNPFWWTEAMLSVRTIAASKNVLWTRCHIRDQKTNIKLKWNKNNNEKEEEEIKEKYKKNAWAVGWFATKYTAIERLDIIYGVTYSPLSIKFLIFTQWLRDIFFLYYFFRCHTKNWLIFLQFFPFVIHTKLNKKGLYANIIIKRKQYSNELRFCCIFFFHFSFHCYADFRVFKYFACVH